tara:strand:+ start:948 stop:1331 length:384 start_codon:yes stop_codon:yes gene_type:complete
MPRKTLKEQKGKRSRISGLLEKLIGTEDADDLMLEIMNVLTESREPPRAGKFYTFVYNAKSPNMRYDQNPLVAVTNVYDWGFKGLNYHWNQIRQYTWDEVAGGGIYEVTREEVEDLRRLPFKNIRSK